MKRYSSLLSLFLGVILVVTLGAFNYSPSGTAIAVIVNKDNPVVKLSASEVKLYWLRKIKSRWPDLNKNIRPADRKGKCPEQDTFYSQVLNMDASSVETYFLTRQYQNAQKPQDKFASDAEMVNFVADEPGAIGYVNVANLSPDQKSRVKIVFTVGG